MKTRFIKSQNLLWELSPMPFGFFAGSAGRLIGEINRIDYGAGKEEIRLAEKQMLARAIGLPAANILSLEQVHGDAVLEVNEPPTNTAAIFAVGDAMITRLQNVCLVIRTADCVPVLLADAAAGAIGAVHSGWKGCRAKIAAKTVAAMERCYGCKPENLRAFVLPAIGPNAYQVGEDVAEFFPKHVLRAEGKTCVNLWAAVRDALIEAGLPDDNIFLCGVCNFSHNDEFFSHRRGDIGRNLNFIYMKG